MSRIRPAVREVGGDAQVLARRRGIAARVVVHHDDGGGVGAHRVPEHLADPHRRAGEVAAVHRPLADDDVLRVEQHHAQLLALEPAHRVDEWLGGVSRGPDDPGVGCRTPAEAGADLDRRGQPGGDGRGEASKPKLDRVGPTHLGQRSEPVERPARQAARRRTAPEEQRQQLGVLARIGSHPLEADGGRVRASGPAQGGEG